MTLTAPALRGTGLRARHDPAGASDEGPAPEGGGSSLGASQVVGVDPGLGACTARPPGWVSFNVANELDQSGAAVPPCAPLLAGAQLASQLP